MPIWVSPKIQSSTCTKKYGFDIIVGAKILMSKCKGVGVSPIPFDCCKWGHKTLPHI